jgi:hypothetical protein
MAVRLHARPCVGFHHLRFSCCLPLLPPKAGDSDNRIAMEISLGTATAAAEFGLYVVTIWSPAQSDDCSGSGATRENRFCCNGLRGAARGIRTPDPIITNDVLLRSG